MFLIQKPVEVRTDGFQTTFTPFIIRYDGKDVYAAFATASVAMYFVYAAGLDKAYEAVALSQTNPGELKDGDYALVLRSESQIDRLLAGKMTASGFHPKLVAGTSAIAGVKSRGKE